MAVWNRWFRPGSSSISTCWLPDSASALRMAAGQHLHVERSVDGEDRAGDFAQRGGRIVGQEIAEPHRGDLADLQADLRLRDLACHFLFQLFLQGCVVFFRLNQREHFLFVCRVLGGLFRALAVRNLDRFALRGKDLISRDAGARHHDNERDVFIARGDHGSDESTFTVADKADLVGIDFGARFQVGDSGFGIGGEVGGRAFREDSG